jgi:hypothetical protein
MPTTRPLSLIATGKRGRPPTVTRKAERIIGSANLTALRAADLHIIPGSLARELALIVGEPIPANDPTLPPVPHAN